MLLEQLYTEEPVRPNIKSFVDNPDIKKTPMFDPQRDISERTWMKVKDQIKEKMEEKAQIVKRSAPSAQNPQMAFHGTELGNL